MEDIPPIASDTYADLEIDLSRVAQGHYRVVLRYLPWAGRTGGPELGPVSAETGFDFAGLEAAALDPLAYGQLLKQAVFAQPELVAFYGKCQAHAGGAGAVLRLRLLIDRTALELYDLRWETLLDPAGLQVLSCEANQPFSRFLPAGSWQRVELRPRAHLRALVVVANPNTRLAGMQEVDVPGEVDRARQGLNELPAAQGIRELPRIDFLKSGAEKVTFEALKARLLRGYDILYLVAHGALLPENVGNANSPRIPFILLEKADGSYDRRRAEELIQYVRDELPAVQRPRLVVLASCQSGGQGLVSDADRHSSDHGALAALGPRLAEAGVPAVLAMQDDIHMETVRQFIPAFFSELLRSGQVDEAAAAARGAIRNIVKDWWVPVLYLSLRGGRLWFNAGFSDVGGFDQWPGIRKSLKQKRCTPVLGSGLLETLVGSTRDLARHWAENSGFPLEPHSQEDLPQVAQYQYGSQGGAFQSSDLFALLIRQLQVKCQDQLPDQYRGINPEDFTSDQLASLLDEILNAVGKKRLEQEPDDPYHILAGLPVEIYITANPDSLLEQALTQADKNPQSLCLCWNKSLAEKYSQSPFELSEPTVKKPLVYHLFGSLKEPGSLVLTEDDYFDYLMRVDRRVPIPDRVVRAWKENALLFLGFQMSDWNFRVLFRSILNEDVRQERLNLRTRRQDYKSVAVQLQPGDENLQPERARRYLESYFVSENFNIFWGSGADFLQELWHQMAPGGGG